MHHAQVELVLGKQIQFILGEYLCVCVSVICGINRKKEKIFIAENYFIQFLPIYYKNA